ncbi:DUF4169 family protein [Aquicoccus porphyridii]|uniref:DUF4169 family protein n=1 Tax=Aquicoccus porphyridii TaxID=1852029 RepID=A0A5A9ZHC2_9RHOB|nr:DUF4169 family protein [Aquicoccus porphyridii]KAA0916601.1 DUF4169 family protein [Aquicoccus porphyridii]RAI53735.1 DUF4169 domain-containing protein [Rhodobacteraceae bacterium AsT-22]
MPGIVNLNKVRKATQRANKKRQADENAIKYGLSKAEKTLAKARADKAIQHLDGKRRKD